MWLALFLSPKCSVLVAFAVNTGYFYEQFVTAVIFVALTNPYNVGDRVCVEGTRVLFVKRIRTYTTEFSDIYGSLASQNTNQRTFDYPLRRARHPAYVNLHPCDC